jgi:hypothetical protein
VFVHSGTVGNYLFAFWDLVHVLLDGVCLQIDGSGNMLRIELVRHVCINEHRRAVVEITPRFASANDIRGTPSFTGVGSAGFDAAGVAAVFEAWVELASLVASAQEAASIKPISRVSNVRNFI